jgi:predicted dehydrogenase
MHNFGWAHAAWIDHTPELELVAICDRDPDRTAAAKQDWPGIETWNSTAEMYEQCELDLVSIVTPHFTHCSLVVEALGAGKHVVVEKAMCLTVDEATQMVDAADAAGRTLAIHHNRRHDGNYRRIKQLVDEGAIGEVFHIELSAGGFGKFDHGWYSQRDLSGGAFYFWGPHAVDWALDLVGRPIVGVNGYFHKLLWPEVDMADQVRAIIRFEGGAVADVCHSHIAAHSKTLWRILGTKGAIVDTGRGATTGYEHQISAPSGGSLTLIRVDESGGRTEEQVPYLECDWYNYWQEMADHLLRGAPVPVSGEFGRRVIGVFEAAERSSATGQTETLAYE